VVCYFLIHACQIFEMTGRELRAKKWIPKPLFFALKQLRLANKFAISPKKAKLVVNALNIQ